MTGLGAAWVTVKEQITHCCSLKCAILSGRVKIKRPPSPVHLLDGTVAREKISHSTVYTVCSDKATGNNLFGLESAAHALSCQLSRVPSSAHALSRQLSRVPSSAHALSRQLSRMPSSAHMLSRQLLRVPSSAHGVCNNICIIGNIKSDTGTLEKTILAKTKLENLTFHNK